MSDLTHYTLTGAADWPMLATVGGVSLLILQAVILVMIGTIYKALPKHSDLQAHRQAINLDIKELAKSFETVLEKHMDREQVSREKKEESMMAAFDRQRTECQARYDRQFDDVFSQLRCLK